MATTNSGNLALLIDGDNVSAKIIVGLMAEIAKYGDWTEPNLGPWKQCLLEHSILPIQQFSYTHGKNATDSAMIIDAMDLLYTNRFSSFCLVSSDSDFTRLAARIRENGVTVYGFGERKTNYAFIAACDKFVYFDVLDVPIDRPEEPAIAHQTPALRANTTTEAITHSRVVARAEPSKRPLDQTALDGLAKAIKNCRPVYGSYVNLADVGTYLARLSPDLNARNYGYERLRDLVEASGIVDLQLKYMSNGPPVVVVRLRENLLEDDDYRMT